MAHGPQYLAQQPGRTIEPFTVTLPREALGTILPTPLPTTPSTRLAVGVPASKELAPLGLGPLESRILDHIEGGQSLVRWAITRSTATEIQCEGVAWVSR